MKKIIALALCLVMVLGLMAGCEKAMDVKTLTQKMDEAAKNQTAAGAKMHLELEMSMAMTGMTMTMAADADMEVKTDLTKNALWMDMDATLDVLGETQEIGMEIYTDAAEDGSMTMYIYESSTDTWMKTAMEGFADQVAQMQESTIVMSEIPQENMTLAEEKQTVGGAECYVLTVDMGGAFFTDQMKAMMEAGTEALDQETAAMMEGIDWSKLNAKTVYYVNAETFQTAQMDLEILGMGEMMNELMGTVMAELMAMMGGEEMEITIDVPVFKASLTEMTYTGIEVPAVPQEAIDNAVDADAIPEDTGDEEWMTSEPQADGSYLLTNGIDSISVFLPEGYSVYMADPEMVMGITEDMMASVTFMLVADITAEEMQAEYAATIEQSKEEGWYLSHSELEPVNGFYQVTLSYTDGSAETCAWRATSTGILLVSGSAFGDAPVLDDALNAIVFAE